jgi:N-acetyltransferase
VSRYLVDPPGTTLAEVEALIRLLLERQRAGTDLAFTTVRKEDRSPVGMTRFLNIDRINRSVDIGGTWLASDLWKSPFNTEAKLLMLRHAFDQEGVHRVRLCTDLRNERSQAAIARLGATREGILRDDRLLRSGYWRSSVVFGILADEWPRVRARLEGRLARPWRPSVEIPPPR